MIIALKSYRWESEAYKRHSHSLLGKSSHFTPHNRSKIMHLQTRAGKEQSTFDQPEDKLLLKELPAHAHNFPAMFPMIDSHK